MPIDPRRPRFGRLLDVVVVTLLVAVFAGLAIYHYRRLDHLVVDPERAKVLARSSFGDQIRTSNDWPQWRGPHRDGVSTETDILRQWPKDGPKALWEAKVGEGFASVVVVNDRAFTIFQDGDNESVVSWEAETGKECWRFSYPRRYLNSFGNGPRSTPSVDGEFIYTVGGTGLMHCLKAFTANPKGEMVWSKDLLKEFSATAPQWGVAFSPLVEGDRVFIMPGGRDGQSLAALDKHTGNVLWNKHNDPASYSSPIAATFLDLPAMGTSIAGLLGTPLGHGPILAASALSPGIVTMFQERQILFFTGSRLVSVNPETGDARWQYPWPIENETNIATPIVVDDYVFISSSYGRGCAMLKIEKEGQTWKPSRVFKSTRMRNHFSTCVRFKDHLYGFDDSTLTCMNFLTGKVEWKERGFDKGSVLLVGDQLIIYGANGLLALADANSKEFVEKANFRFSNAEKSCWSVPVVSNGRLYVRDQEKLVCYDVRAGN
jgi:outer membrane protein assembly factor BamB